MISEKQQKLFGITRIIGSYFVETYEAVLVCHAGRSLDHSDNVRWEK